MSRIFLVRHGETIWHAENRYAGKSDIPLTERGLEQAQTLAMWSRAADLTHLYVSPLQRARDTLAAVEQATGLQARIDNRLREVDFGIAEGLTAPELQERFAGAWAGFLENPVECSFPSGEDPNAAASRVRNAVDEIAERCGPEARVLIVAHSTLFRVLLCNLLGLPLSRYRSLFPSLRNAAVSELEIGAGKVALYSFNVPLRSSF
jgi:probable phosphoglycerate mutase